ncbi:MICOS complex subunit Mic10-like [Thrips palmi]|uniref:MICOS complex subunit MIC10 n=1 Tax=Thrips palmi TaxID=161013 RepID=A0A6P8ZNJ9_THRPL|nr:MICOS complex subunit Mic10-like [Thrips palmi]
MSRPIFSEDEPGRKWDKCVTDAVLKTGGGVAIGAVCSVLFFSRKGWPLLFGGGFGVGMAYANCERALNNSLYGQNLVKSANKC